MNISSHPDSSDIDSSPSSNPRSPVGGRTSNIKIRHSPSKRTVIQIKPTPAPTRQNTKQLDQPKKQPKQVERLKRQSKPMNKKDKSEVVEDRNTNQVNPQEQVPDDDQSPTAQEKPEKKKKGNKKGEEEEQEKQDSFLKDELLSLFNYPFNKQIVQNIMGGELSQDEVQEKIKELGQTLKFAHGKLIAAGEPYFRCLDCEIIKNTNQRTYICRFCFEKRSHAGHRFLLFNDATGNETCDCGNESLLDNRWFCSDHGTCQEEEYKNVLEAVPSGFLSNFNKIIKQACYEAIFACEVHLKGLQANIRNCLNKAMEAILSSLAYFNDQNPVFTILISEALTEKVQYPKRYKGFIFVDEKHAKKNPEVIAESLNFTYLEALMRYSLLFKEEVQVHFRELLLSLSRCEEFKKRLVLSFHSIAHHLFKIKPQRPFNFSNLAYLTSQIYASEQNCLRVIKEGSFEQITSVLRQYGKLYEPTLDVGGKVLNRLLHLFELILEKENPGRKFLEKEEVVGKFLMVMLDFQNTRSYEARGFPFRLKMSSNDLNIQDYWYFEGRILSLNEKLVTNAGHILEQQGFDQNPDLFLIDWGERVIQDMEQEFNPSEVRLNIPLQRAMIQYLQHTLDRVDSTRILEHLEYIRRSCPDGIEYLVAQTLGTIGLMRRAMLQIDGWNINTNPVVERYFAENGPSFFDYDFAFIQLFSLVLSEEETNMFELYYANFFGHDPELITMFHHADFSKATEFQMHVFEDFLCFLVQLLHGEISFFNVFYKAPCLVDHGSKKTFDQIHRKVLINFLHKTYQYFPITTLKQDFKYILRADIFHEKIIKDIADVDKVSKNFKLKRAYLPLFDSFYIYPDRLINSKITHNVRIHNKIPEIAELGNFSQSLTYLDTVQQIFYQGDMIQWCDKMFTNFTSNSTYLIPSLVKLILMPLKMLEKSKKVPLPVNFKEKVIIPLFGNKGFLEKLKKAHEQVDVLNIASSLSKLINVFVPNSNTGSLINTSIFDLEEERSFFENNLSLNPSRVIQESMTRDFSPNLPQVREWDEKDLMCRVCQKQIDLNSMDVGIPAYISRSNVNYWELQGRRFRKPFQTGDEDALRVILGLLKKYSPYAAGIHPRDIDFLDDGVPADFILDFYPALNSCMHYIHRGCFAKACPMKEGNPQEFECPICRKLSNMFIGMEKVDAASRKLIEEQVKKNKKFLDFLRKQAVVIPMLPDPTLKFDFYNSFMHGLFPKYPELGLKPNDPSADKKILKFTNLIRASFFQLVRNSLINDFETFMSRSYMCYKFAFVNLQSFIMKNYQFHQYFEAMNQEITPTIFHILNHKGLMQELEVPSMRHVYFVFKEALGLVDQDEKQEKQEKQEKPEKGPKRKDSSGAISPAKKSAKGESTPKKTPVKRNGDIPAAARVKAQDTMYEMNKRNKGIMMAYNYKTNVIKMNELFHEGGSQRMIGMSGMMDSYLTSSHHDIDISKDEVNVNASFDSHYSRGRSIGSTPEPDEGPKEEELFDDLQRMMLLLESETEEDFMLAFWETFLRFMLTNRMKDQHTNLDLTMLPVDFLYLRTLLAFQKTMISEKAIRMRQQRLPDFEDICKWIANNEALKDAFTEEMISITQRIIVSCIIVFDFDKCVEISSVLEFLSELKGNREGFLNCLLGFLQRDLTLSTILSKKFWDLSPVYKNFFYVWRENLAEFLSKTHNPFELMAKNVVEIKPLVIDLPSNFNEFNSEYLPRKCDRCEEFCEYCKTILCLQCGKVLCRDRCKKKIPKTGDGVQRLPGDIQMSTDSEDTGESRSASASLDRADSRASPLRPRPVPTKYVRKSPDAYASKQVKRTKTLLLDKQRRQGDIMTFDDNLNVEANDSKEGILAPIFQPLAIIKKNRHLEHSHTHEKIREEPSRITPSMSPKRNRKEITVLPNLSHNASPIKREAGLKERGGSPQKNWNSRAASFAKLEKSTLLPKLFKADTVEFDKDGHPEREESGKKRKKKKRRGNMHRHAEECHKGHAIYICIQDQSVILFSKPRDVVYPEKLYVDRFGQTLTEKHNIFEEDWNSFELNPYVLKKLRDAVENHSLPQLVYAIIKNHYKPS